MIYDFAAKINDIKHTELFDDTEALEKRITEMHELFDNPININLLVSESNAVKGLLIKAQVSISKLSGFHDQELDERIDAFKRYMDEIALAVDGEISRKEAFYNNSKTFSRLYI